MIATLIAVRSHVAAANILLAESAAGPAIDEKRVFASTSLTVGGKIFAMLVRDRLVVKLPRTRVDDLVSAGAGGRFDPGHGRVWQEWLSLAPNADEDLLELSREALAFVTPRGQ